MGVFDGYRVKKPIETLLASRLEAGPETTQAMTKLKTVGRPAIPKIIDALARTQTPEFLMEVLNSLLQNSTLPLFTERLTSSEPRIVAGVANVLAQNKSYDPQLLLRLFADPGVPKATLAKILASHRHVLQTKSLLEVLETVKHNDCQVLLRCIDNVATADAVHEIIRRLPRVGEGVRLPLVRTLTRFQEAPVRDALVRLLQDPHTSVRQAALEGLMGMKLPIDLGVVCPLLRDDDRTIRRQAMTFLIHRRDAQILPQLFGLLQDSDADVRQGAIEVLNVVGTPETFRGLVTAQGGRIAMREMLFELILDSHVAVRLMALEGIEALEVPIDVTTLIQLLRDRDTQVRRKAIALLTQSKDPKLFDELFSSVKDASNTVRQSVAEVLDAISNPQVIKELLEALHDAEVWIRERVIETLGKTAHANLIHAIVMLVKDEDESIRRQALDMLQHNHSEEVFQTLVQALQTEDVWTQECAAEALAVLGDKRAVPALVEMMQNGDTARSLVAIRTLAALNDAHAVPALLEHLQKGEEAVREEILRVLATVTDATHAGTVLQAVMEARSTNNRTMRELANVTASVVIRRFGDYAVLPSRLSSESVAMTFADLAAAAAPSAGAPLASVPAARKMSSLLEETTIGRLGDEPTTYDAAFPPQQPLAAFPDHAPDSEVPPDVLNMKPGTLLANRYRIIRQVGRGGFGTVFLVEDTRVHEEIILKFLNAHIATDENMVGRFIHELRYARRVTHENVIRIHDLLTFGDVCAISMEYFPSHSLSEELKDRQPLPFELGFKVMLDVCRAMSVAHHAKVVHRDLKPANILIDDQKVVKVVDFGLAAAVSGMDTRLTATGAVLGTPAYMAPEQVRSGVIDARTDVYSLGIIMYEIFTGMPPYLGDSALSVLFQHVEGNPVPPREKNPQILPALEDVILRAMAVDPEQRFQSVDELYQQLVVLTKTE